MKVWKESKNSPIHSLCNQNIRTFHETKKIDKSTLFLTCDPAVEFDEHFGKGFQMQIMRTVKPAFWHEIQVMKTFRFFSAAILANLIQNRYSSYYINAPFQSLESQIGTILKRRWDTTGNMFNCIPFALQYFWTTRLTRATNTTTSRQSHRNFGQPILG